ncbi:hypothetical protein FRC12_010534 [Ceratobasidium sp. 428]|nr:hypothetical protein FRC12_010534 [Ceratobasidium sp. 428]
MFTLLCNHVETYRAQLRPGEGILIHCRSSEQVEQIAKALRAVMHYSGYEHSAESARMWLNGEVQVIVTTSGLGAGVHHPCCRVTIHYESDYGVLGYMQTTGRAGRDGLPALCLLFHRVKQPRRPLAEIDALYKGWDSLMEMLENKQCQRLTVSSWLDGLNLRVSCASGDYAPCGWCADKRAEIARDPDSLIAAFSNRIQQPERASRNQKLYCATDMVVSAIPRIQNTVHQSPTISHGSQPQPTEPSRVTPAEHVENLAALTHRSTTPVPWTPNDQDFDTVMQSPEVFSTQPPTSSTFSPRLGCISNPQPHTLPTRSAQLHSHTTTEGTVGPGGGHHASWNPLSSTSSSQASSTHPRTTAKLQNREIQNIAQRAKAPKKSTGLVILQSRSAKSASAAACTQAVSSVPGSTTDQVRRMMDRLSGCCMICLTEKGIHQCSSHTTDKCPPVTNKGYTLPLHLIGNMNLHDAKKKGWMKIPSKRGLCYRCLFPESMHETGFQYPDCKASDVLYPLLWLLLHNSQIRKPLLKFENGEPNEQDVQVWMDWLVKEVPDQFFQPSPRDNVAAPVLNLHTIAIQYLNSKNWLAREEPVSYYEGRQPGASRALLFG